LGQSSILGEITGFCRQGPLQEPRLADLVGWEDQMATLIFEYAAKFICGLQKDPEDLRLTLGLYGTEVNVHNPNEEAVRLTKKLALTFPPGDQQPGEILRLGEDLLRPDQALAVDCNHVRVRLFPGGLPAPYITGFVVIESTGSLDVTAVYTTAALDEQGNVTGQRGIDVEQIHEREKRGQPELPDLIPVPDATGSFCRVEDGALIVTVRNQGLGTAGPSTTHVDFSGGGAVSMPTPRWRLASRWTCRSRFHPDASARTAGSGSPWTPTATWSRPTRPTTPPAASASARASRRDQAAAATAVRAEQPVGPAGLEPATGGLRVNQALSFW
jgi:hypothetical protein